MTSIRNYLTGRLLLGSACLLIVSQVCLYYFVRTRSISQFDASLTMTARVVAELTRQNPSEIRLLSSVYELVPDFLRDHGDYYFQIWLADEEVLDRSHSLHGVDLPRQIGSRLEPSTGDFYCRMAARPVESGSALFRNIRVFPIASFVRHGKRKRK